MLKNISLLLVIIISLAIIVFSYVIPAFYLSYIKKMNEENCKCSKDFSRHFIHFYSIYIYVALGILIFIVMMGVRKDLKTYMRNPSNLVISIGFSFLVGYYLFTYNKRINEENCECANTWEVTVMKYHSYLVFIMVFIASLNIINILSGKSDFRDYMSVAKNRKNILN